jgi:hypothetical protein
MLDHFMATVILPLAAQTNAFVLCSACPNTCMFSSSLTRMFSVPRSTWGREPPFTVLSTTASWLATRFFSDAWELLPASVKQEAAAAGVTSMMSYYADNITALSVHIRTILNGRNFHHVNLHDIDGAFRLVGELVKLDRLPNETSYQGLLLLCSAWCEFDGAH